ncbi:MAG: 3-dehydroquinate synthase [Methyloligella sp. ZOD6]
MQGVMRDALGEVEAPGEERVFFQQFQVAFEYPVYFTRDLFAPGNSTFSGLIRHLGGQGKAKLAIFVDDGVLREMPDLIRRIRSFGAQADDEASDQASFEIVGDIMPLRGGEQAKNEPGLVAELQKKLVELGLDRHSYVVAIGGGAVLDLVGYAAATTHRGIRHIRVPTTVLAQNDSGVGVKNGVNAFDIKNLLGSFAPPAAVINDSAFIDVLPGRDKRAGMSEAVKVALIRDGAFFEWLEETVEDLAIFSSKPLDRLIRHCAVLHMRQIAHGGDPFERGSVRPLDFGHWSAHKLEALSDYDLRHGEAVAIGIALDTRYSVLAGHLPEGSDVRVRNLLERLGFELWHPACDIRNAQGELKLLDGLEEFRAHLGGELTVTLLEEIGTGVEVHRMDPVLIKQALEWLRPEVR